MNVMVIRTLIAVFAIVLAAFPSMQRTVHDLDRARQQTIVLKLVSPEESIRLTRNGAERGNLDAQLLLARASYNGTKYFPQDFAEAAYWYAKAADQGNSRAQRTLAFMYERGEGVEKDEARALVLYRAAAGSGDMIAQINAAYMLNQGRGAPVDREEAQKLFRNAVAHGYSLPATHDTLKN